jgi:hypothetical protein
VLDLPSTGIPQIYALSQCNSQNVVLAPADKIQIVVINQIGSIQNPRRLAWDPSVHSVRTFDSNRLVSTIELLKDMQNVVRVRVLQVDAAGGRRTIILFDTKGKESFRLGIFIEDIQGNIAKGAEHPSLVLLLKRCFYGSLRSLLVAVGTVVVLVVVLVSVVVRQESTATQLDVHPAARRNEAISAI